MISSQSPSGSRFPFRGFRSIKWFQCDICLGIWFFASKQFFSWKFRQSQCFLAEVFIQSSKKSVSTELAVISDNGCLEVLLYSKWMTNILGILCLKWNHEISGEPMDQNKKPQITIAYRIERFDEAKRNSHIHNRMQLEKGSSFF